LSSRRPHSVPFRPIPYRTNQCQKPVSICYMGRPSVRPLLGLEHPRVVAGRHRSRKAYDVVVGGVCISGRSAVANAPCSTNCIVSSASPCSTKGDAWLVREFGPTATPVALPDGGNELAELSAYPGGPRLFAEALLVAVRNRA
jgi:hypothetical protein